ncbi:Fer-1-like protein 6 [Thelohanellus kitauei]|uniref:Fer-1-like protein 6 n=1 Tax=Thelohanellus kitauei TaxID=669202 RepID=A0A0C2JLJ8_THEKT|nr:Fer-1-like protein 6 [Thelohanellus kitauei]
MVPPVIHFQVWDQDLISSDDFLGSLELNLLKMPTATRNPKSCTLNQLKNENTVSLFEVKTLRGWYPFSAMDEFDMPVIAGKVELEFNLVDLETATKNPVGKAREEPEPLLSPK